MKTNFCPAFSEEWVRGFHDVPQAKQDTTGACEGFHSALKGDELAMKTQLQGRRVDWLLHSKQIVASAVIAAQQIPDSSVDLVDSTGQLAYLTSKDDPSLKYEVKAAGTSKASCTCPNGQLHCLCKHMMKVVSLSTGHSGAEIIQALGTRARSSLQGLGKLQSSGFGNADFAHNSKGRVSSLTKGFKSKLAESCHFFEVDDLATGNSACLHS